MFDALTHRASFDGDRTDTFVVGTVLTLATAAAPLLGILLLGYVVGAIRHRTNGAGVPAFDDWRGIARDGLRAAAVVAPFHLPAAGLVAFVGVGRMLHGISSLALVGTWGFTPDYGAVAAVVVLALLELVAGYLSVATVVTLARTDSLSSRLPSRVVSVASDRRFARAFGLVLAVGLLVRLARLALGVLPFVGGPLGALVSFGGVVVAASVLAPVVPESATDRLASRAAAVAPDADGTTPEPSLSNG